jgi:hypothetical protein
MRCYFHLVHADERLLDEEGVEAESAAQARDAVLSAIAEVREADPSIADYWEGWTLSAVDEVGQHLFSLALVPVPARARVN